MAVLQSTPFFCRRLRRQHDRGKVLGHSRLRRWTIAIPENRSGKYRKCFHPSADGLKGLCAHYNAEWQPAHADDGAQRVGVDVYARVANMVIEEEELAFEL